MKNVLLGTLSFIVVIVLLIAFSFGGNTISLKFRSYFGPKFQNVEREIFEETKSYNQGKVQELAKYYEEYHGASNEDKKTIKAVILMKFADYNADRLENGLSEFLKNIRGY